MALCYLFEDLLRGRAVLPTIESYAELAPYADLIRTYSAAPAPFVIGGEL